jgi:hypothetical protein
MDNNRSSRISPFNSLCVSTQEKNMNGFGELSASMPASIPGEG